MFTNNPELVSLYAEKGEIMTQMEMEQNKLMQINQRIGQILNSQGISVTK